MTNPRPPTVIVKKHKHTVILDLDDTVIQTYFCTPKNGWFSPHVSDYKITVCKGGTLSLFGKHAYGIVCIRPGTLRFWKDMQARYNIAVWSAAERNYVHLMVGIIHWYAKHILNVTLDRPVFIWDKSHLSKTGTKDLRLLPLPVRNLSVLLDDNELHRGYNGKQFVKCKPYTLYADNFMFGTAQNLVQNAIRSLG